MRALIAGLRVPTPRPRAQPPAGGACHGCTTSRREKEEILTALERGDLDGKQALQLVRSLVGQNEE